MSQKFSITCLFVLILNFSFSQEKFHINLESIGLVSSTDKLMPHYQYSNNYGLISYDQKSHFLLMGGMTYQLAESDNFALKAGMTGIFKDQIDESFLYQAYLRGKLFKLIDFSIGKEAYTPVSYNDRLTMGGFLINSNARPIPKITLGFYDYLSLPFFNDWIEVKGGITQGWLNDDRTSEEQRNSADDPLLHEKWAYIRLGKTKIQPYVGVIHSSIYGGTRPDGTQIPVDFIATFFAKGSKSIGGGEATNAAGAHEGFWDFGAYVKSDWGNMLFYWQKPFSDGSGMKLLNFRNKDFKIGSILHFEDSKIIKNISIEFLRTDYQSGPGICDPVYPQDHPKAGQIINLREVDDYDVFMLDVFNVSTSGWGRDEVLDYFEKEQNHGYKYGGRDDYNNNATYYNGWTYYGQSFGMPLYHTQSQMTYYAPHWNPNELMFIKNNRVRAVHFGVEGDICNGISYLLKSTYSKNFGTYGEQYKNAISWDEKEDYFFKGGKRQVYSNIELNYSCKKFKMITFKFSCSFDFGELYNSVGTMIGVRYILN
nr:hypothetical protein [uncultured Carboxylicivirga sp.]